MSMARLETNAAPAPAPAPAPWPMFQSVRQPTPPSPRNRRWARNPLDAFVAAARDERGLSPRPEARREILLRRVYLDLIGLTPTPEEQAAFLADTSADAYEKVVDRLLADPRHSERWARHWMDIWRYSDWAGWSGGNQIRDSQPHIWRWRDWIVESLQADKGYDRMLVEMLAADEIAPLDADALRATGFLVRNYKMLSREQWMEDTIKHTAQAFLGVTMGCAKCHDHRSDPISQEEYYRMRAIFDPHHVRIDRLPGEPDPAKTGLVRAFDTATNRVTPVFIRGDERHPDTNRLAEPGVPAALCGDTDVARSGGRLAAQPVHLPEGAARPDAREFVRQDLLAVSQRAVDAARAAAATPHPTTAASSSPGSPTSPASGITVAEERVLALAAAEARHRALQSELEAERLEERLGRDAHRWHMAALDTTAWQRTATVAEARLAQHRAATAATAAAHAAREVQPTNAPAPASAPAPGGADAKAAKAAKALEQARQKLADATKALAQAEADAQAPASTQYRPRPTARFPAESTGRRLAFAQWVVDPANPLTARVAMNHLWLRHFGRGLVPNPADFGRGARPPSHPALLDWLAAEFMAQGWSLKAMHRLMVTSSTYRMASTPDDAAAALDPDNVFLWRMPSRRLEAEAIRDNLLHVAGDLDLTRGGPEIDQEQGLTSRRRSLYLRLAAEKEVEFLRIFDGPAVTECYERRPSVLPQQALALANSELAFREASALAQRLSAETGADDTRFIRAAHLRVLGRPPRESEIHLCQEFLAGSVPTDPGAESLVPRAAASVGAGASTTKATATASDPHARRREHLLLVLFNHHDFVTVR
jgi:hypothetical protein